MGKHVNKGIPNIICWVTIIVLIILSGIMLVTSIIG